MENTIFNLLDERWIIVTNLKGDEEMLSLIDVLIRSHELKSLSGEMPSQDLAIMRLLLGVLYPIYTRTEEYWEAQEDESKDACIRIWEDLWECGHFPENEIKGYLMQHHDRFWLRHPERPFYQVVKIEKGSDFMASKMIGELVEGGNKAQLFPTRSGAGKQFLEYPEAARWLLYLNSFDDASAKPSRKGLESMSVGWLGQLGLVYVTGENLFETLMLNFSLLNDSKPWENGKAVWELAEPRTSERTIIAMPGSGEELFTLQSRRIQLKYHDNKVAGFTLLGGDKFNSEEAFVEPMTMWRFSKGKSGQRDMFLPPSNAARNPARHLWRDFAPLLSETEGGSEKSRKPGILRWISELEYENIIPSKQIQISTLSIKYGNMQSGVDEVWSDSLSVNANILSDLASEWIDRIADIVKITEDLVRILGNLASNIERAAGSPNGDNYRELAMQQAYAGLDIPFRNWLASIDRSTSDIVEECGNWLDTAKKIILDHGEFLVSQAGTQAFVGRTVKFGAKEDYYSTPKVYGWFVGNIFKKLGEATQQRGGE
ncbi:MAG: type I-E CRISPR-associated protein Cse1/CasA [Eubacteriaceae bacterium]|nr:type I-E CRISPR-associated protein Cse1/CasA [Eubacteriaceae bacterium]